ncbi:MAG: ABC transporter substrate-binding protein [Armatimonadaceae bacterium]
MRNHLFLNLTAIVALGSTMLLSAGCSNNPYPPGESAQNIIYRTMADDPKSLDPTFSYTVDEAAITDLIYPSYYKYHYLKRNPFQLVLNLGTKEAVREPYTVTVTDKDGNKKQVAGERYTFTIRKDLKFQDDPCFLPPAEREEAKKLFEQGEKPKKEGPGRPITAADIIYSYKRMADPSTHSPVAPFFADKVLGWNEYSAAFEKQGAANYANEIEGVQLDPNDPYTFYVLLKEPYPQLRYLMAMHFTTPQAPEALEFYGKDEYARNPVGCGPYKMTEFKPKQRIVLEENPNRHPDYYPMEGDPGDQEAGLLQDAGEQLPLNKKVVVNIIKEAVTGWNLFQQGYLDAAGVSRLNYQQAITSSGTLSPEMQERGIVLRKDAGVNIYYLAFNMSDPVFGGYTEKKRKLRQAISLSINAQEFIDVLLQGNGVAAQWLLPPSVFGYDKDYVNPYRNPGGDYEKNLEKAKQLLREAGYPDGVDPKTGQKLVLHYDNTATTPDQQQQVGIVSKMIERIGIKVESRTTRYNVFQDKLLKGQHQFIFYGWFADYPDPENFVFLLYGPNKKPGPNAADYVNPEYDRVFEQMRAMDDGPERLALINRLREISVEDVPWIPVYHSVTMSLNHGWLKNVNAHPIANDLNQYRRVDAEERVRLQNRWNQPNYVPLIALAVVLIGGTIPALQVVRQRVNRRVRRDGANGGTNP